MKIAYVVSQYPAASHTFIRREIAALRVAGLEIDTFSIRSPVLSELSSSRDQFEFGATYYLLPLNWKALILSHAYGAFCRPRSYIRVFSLALRHRVPGIRAILWSLFHFAEAIQLAKELEIRKIGRVHNHFANSGATVGLLASKFLELPWSLTLHGISETDYPAGLLLAAKIEAASFVACVSEFGRAQAMRVSSPEHWQKLHIVRCALNFDELPIKAERGVSLHGARLICVARLSPEKGHAGLLNAFADVLARGFDAELVLVGDGPQRAMIENIIIRLNLVRKVRLAGSLSEAATLNEIAEADILVIASFMEGLPVVLMEAMALGIPVVATRVAGIPELVVEGQTGLLFSPSNWQELSAQVSQLLNNSDLQIQLGEAGRKKVFTFHNTQTAFLPLIEYFESIDP